MEREDRETARYSELLKSKTIFKDVWKYFLKGSVTDTLNNIIILWIKK